MSKKARYQMTVRSLKTKAFPAGEYMSDKQIFAGHNKPIKLGFSGKENPNANHEECCPVRKSFDKKQRPESRNAVNSPSGVCEEPRPNDHRRICGSWRIWSQGESSSPRCAHGRCQEEAFRRSACVEVRSVCQEHSALGSGLG